MNQLKVFEFAKEIGVETLALMDKIREWKLPVKSHMATLDDAMMAEIKTRLSGAAQSAAEADAKAKKKTVRKKADAGAEPAAAASVKAKTKKVSAASEEAAEKPKKAVVKKTAATKTTKAPAKTATKATATKAAGAASAGTVKRPSAPAVIRRKAGEPEPKPEVTPSTVSGPEMILDESTGEMVAAPVGAGAEEATAPRAEEPAVKTRRNIVGRMDLRRVATHQGSGTQQGGGSGGAPGGGMNTQGGPGAPRVSRTAPRNIRTGFFSAEPTLPEFSNETFESKAAREEAKAKKRPGARGEEEVKVFTATEFRKREVIFQPKKKKSIVGGKESKKTQVTTPAAHKRVVKVNGTIKLSDLANEIGVKAPLLVKKLMTEGLTVTMNSDLDFDTVALTVPEFGWEAINVKKTEAEMLEASAHGDLEAEKITRPPVVTVMGHVDHGKTSLLDSIRNAKVAAGEAGGITQHIGAYSVPVNGKLVTFIDTPGHEAFTAMRARGANVTDIAIIVVAADDGMMPQTAEAINHAKAAGVPIIVAVNKMDKPSANPEKIKQQLTEFELVPEEWGGTTIYCPVSALKGTGIKELLEQILLVAEMADLKANPKRSGTGTVIESRMDKGRGVVASLIVKDGTVSVGQVIVAGTVVGRVRSMLDDKGKPVKDVGPGLAVEILGLPETPAAGDRFDICASEEIARQIAEDRKAQVVKEENPNSKMTLEQLFSRVKSGDVKELSLVLKSDVAGSQEAVKALINKLGNDEVKVKIIHSAIGAVNESDVLLASTAKGVVVGFNVRPDTGAQRIAKEKGIEIKCYTIIYELVDDLKKALSGLLAPEVVEKAMGRAEVRNTFTVPKLGMIAGCAVVDGKIARNHQLRLLRDGRIIFEGKLASLKRFKDDAKEVAAGFECGIGIENYNDIKVGDIIEAFVKEEIHREL